MKTKVFAYQVVLLFSVCRAPMGWDGWTTVMTARDAYVGKASNIIRCRNGKHIGGDGNADTTGMRRMLTQRHGMVTSQAWNGNMSEAWNAD